MEDKKDEIVINVDGSQNAQVFSYDELIHKRTFDQIRSRIEALIKPAETKRVSDDDEFSVIEKHDAIAVFGGRGVGKTSFLRSLAGSYSSEDSKVEVLPMIDPTLIEEKGHVFLLILSLIRQKVMCCLQENECSLNTKTYNDRVNWEKCLDKLAKGLPSLDHVGGTFEDTSWQDDSYIMEQGLASVYSAHELQRNFRNVVKKALSIINDKTEKKAFLLVFDDIDVSFLRGWPVLETIRKYLVIPEIITIISGNAQLYSKAIRKVQWENFGKALLINEQTEEDKKEYRELVSELEEQYMLKIFRADNRFYLHSIYEYMQQTNSPEYLVEYKTGENGTGKSKMGLKIYYENICDSYGIRGRTAKNWYVNYLLSLPIRTQIHFLSNHKEGHPDEEHNIDALHSRMRNAMIDVDTLSDVDISAKALKYMLDNNILSEAYQMLPNMDSLDINTCLVGLSLKFDLLSMKNPSLIFDYLTRIGYTRDIDTFLYPNIKSATDYALAGMQRSLKEIIGYEFAYSLSKNVNAKSLGQQQIYSTAEKGKMSSHEEEYRIDYVLNHINSGDEEKDGINKLLGYIPISVLNFNRKDGSFLYYSIYSLLGAIGNLLACSNEEAIKEELRNLSIEHSFMVPDESKNNSDKGNYTSSFVIEKLGEDSINKMATDISSWKGKYANVKNSPTYLLGRISTRLYYTINNITMEYIGKELGEYMRLSVLGFLNAVLIEECAEKNTELLSKLNKNNVRTSDEVYKNNKNVVQGSIDKLPLYKWISECPLLTPFAPSSLLTPSTLFAEVKVDKNLYDELQKVYLSDNASAGEDKISFKYASYTMNDTAEKIKECGFDLDDVLTNPSTADVVENLKTKFKNISEKSLDKFRENYGKAHK